MYYVKIVVTTKEGRCQLVKLFYTYGNALKYYDKVVNRMVEEDGNPEKTIALGHWNRENPLTSFTHFFRNPDEWFNQKLYD